MATNHQPIYDGAYHLRHAGGSRSSAKVIVPLILTLLGPERISSVIDVGCGLGLWLAEFLKSGIPHCIGLDGGDFHESLLAIPPANFKRVDFVNGALGINSEFDLAISLEVAEHLLPESADGYVQSLCRLSDTLLFSAAVPGQTGRGHFNEQWPEYWAERFDAHGFVPVDCIRPLIPRNDPRVKFWYGQNTFIYVKREKLDKYPNLRDFQKITHKDRLSWVHPILFEQRIKEARKRADCCKNVP